jgi:hypothetical protein
VDLDTKTEVNKKNDMKLKWENGCMWTNLEFVWADEVV